MSTAGGPGARGGSIYLLPQEEQTVVIDGQEVRSPLGSGRQFLSPLEGGEKKDFLRDPISVHLLDGGTLRAWESGIWAGLHNIPLSSASASPVPSASKTSSHFSSPCPCHLQSRPSMLAHMPASLSSLWLSACSTSKKEYFPTAAGRSFKTF